MAAPTDLLADDVKTLREDLKVLREDLHRFETAITADVREVSTQVKGLLSSIRILALLVLTSLASSIWWGATLASDVRHLASDVARLVEQTKPAAPK